MSMLLKFSDYTEISKQETDSDIVYLFLKNDRVNAVLKCITGRTALNIDSFLEMPSNGVAVDRQYFIDILRRVALNDKDVAVKVGIGENPYCIIESRQMHQEIPVLKAKGEGTYEFSILPELLNSVTLSYVNYGDTLYLYLDKVNNSTTLCISDNSQLWHTKIRGLLPIRGNFDWNDKK